jgi:hypothetical protein
MKPTISRMKRCWEYDYAPFSLQTSMLKRSTTTTSTRIIELRNLHIAKWPHTPTLNLQTTIGANHVFLPYLSMRMPKHLKMQKKINV